MRCYVLLYVEVIEVANDMSAKHGINRLSCALRELYYKLCDMDLHRRLTLYHRSTSTNKNPDISASLTKHIDKLAPSSKPGSAGTTNTAANTATDRLSNRVSRHGNIKQFSQQHGWLNKVVSSVIRPKKIFASDIASNRYTGH